MNEAFEIGVACISTAVIILVVSWIHFWHESDIKFQEEKELFLAHMEYLDLEDNPITILYQIQHAYDLKRENKKLNRYHKRRKKANMKNENVKS